MPSCSCNKINTTSKPKPIGNNKNIGYSNTISTTSLGFSYLETKSNSSLITTVQNNDILIVKDGLYLTPLGNGTYSFQSKSDSNLLLNKENLEKVK